MQAFLAVLLAGRKKVNSTGLPSGAVNAATGHAARRVISSRMLVDGRRQSRPFWASVSWSGLQMLVSPQRAAGRLPADHRANAGRSCG